MRGLICAEFCARNCHAPHDCGSELARQSAAGQQVQAQRDGNHEHQGTITVRDRLLGCTRERNTLERGVEELRVAVVASGSILALAAHAGLVQEEVETRGPPRCSPLRQEREKHSCRPTRSEQADLHAQQQHSPHLPCLHLSTLPPSPESLLPPLSRRRHSGCASRSF